MESTTRINGPENVMLPRKWRLVQRRIAAEDKSAAQNKGRARSPEPIFPASKDQSTFTALVHRDGVDLLGDVFFLGDLFAFDGREHFFVRQRGEVFADEQLGG